MLWFRCSWRKNNKYPGYSHHAHLPFPPLVCPGLDRTKVAVVGSALGCSFPMAVDKERQGSCISGLWGIADHLRDLLVECNTPLEAVSRHRQYRDAAFVWYQPVLSTFFR